MSGKAFIDTNVFVYGVDSKTPGVKRDVANGLIRSALAGHRSVISWQVIQEFMNVATGKLASSLSISDAHEYLNSVFRLMIVVQPSVDLFSDALDIRTRYKISWYDSLIIAAAAEANCPVVYTEDLQHGAKFGGVRIENPFRV
jgi:predicted nucleic acid-binding protein